jgi:hypothetical protein
MQCEAVACGVQGAGLRIALVLESRDLRLTLLAPSNSAFYEHMHPAEMMDLVHNEEMAVQVRSASHALHCTLSPVPPCMPVPVVRKAILPPVPTRDALHA